MSDKRGPSKDDVSGNVGPAVARVSMTVGLRPSPAETTVMDAKNGTTTNMWQRSRDWIVGGMPVVL